MAVVRVEVVDISNEGKPVIYWFGGSESKINSFLLFLLSLMRTSRKWVELRIWFCKRRKIKHGLQIHSLKELLISATKLRSNIMKTKRKRKIIIVIIIKILDLPSSSKDSAAPWNSATKKSPNFKIYIKARDSFHLALGKTYCEHILKSLKGTHLFVTN